MPSFSKAIRYGGCSSVGRASDCGSECRGFESRHPPHKPLRRKGRSVRSGPLLLEPARLGCSQVVRHGTLTPAFAGSSPATPANYHKMLVRFCAKMLPSSNWNRRLASQAGNTGSSPVGSTKWCRGRIGRVAGLSSRSLRVQSPPASP